MNLSPRYRLMMHCLDAEEYLRVDKEARRLHLSTSDYLRLKLGLPTLKRKRRKDSREV